MRKHQQFYFQRGFSGFYLYQNPPVEAAETGVDLTTGQNLRTRLIEENSVSRRTCPTAATIFWDPPPSFSLVEHEPRVLFSQVGSPRTNSAQRVEQERSAPRTEVEDSMLDSVNRSTRMVSGERSQDTHSSRNEVLNPEDSSTNGTVTRERSQDTQRSQMSAHLHSDGGLQDPAEELSSNGVTRERSQDTHSSRKEVLDPAEELSSNGVTREKSLDTHSSRKEVLDLAEELSSNGVTRERSQVTHSSRKEVLDPTEALSSNGTVTRERS